MPSHYWEDTTQAESLLHTTRAQIKDAKDEMEIEIAKKEQLDQLPKEQLDQLLVPLSYTGFSGVNGRNGGCFPLSRP